MRPLENIKSDFPIFQNHPELVYLDNAATTQCPKTVIAAINNFYSFERSTVHRGAYALSEKNSEKVDQVRSAISTYLNAHSKNDMAFTSGTTASINIVAEQFLRPILKTGDNIVISILEHHANYLPWQYLAKTCQVELRIIPMDANGELDRTKIQELVDNKTKLLAITHISNVTGTISPIKEITEYVRKKSIPVLIDGAQSAALYPVDLQELDCDFFTCSGHKMFGPFGIGILYSHPRNHSKFSPHFKGGGIVESVRYDETIYMKYPRVLEAGTPNIEGIVGLGAALEYLEGFNRMETSAYISNLANIFRQKILEMEGFTSLGDHSDGTGIVSIIADDLHSHDVATLLSSNHIAVRAGHHCAEPLMHSLGINGTLRVSFSIYNTIEDIYKLETALKEVRSFWI